MRNIALNRKHSKHITGLQQKQLVIEIRFAGGFSLQPRSSSALRVCCAETDYRSGRRGPAQAQQRNIIGLFGGCHERGERRSNRLDEPGGRRVGRCIA